MGKIALLTGASGFVGSHLGNKLNKEGWSVHVIVRKNSNISLCGLGNATIIHEFDGEFESLNRIVQLAKPDIVFHLASLFLSQHCAADIPALVQSNLLFPLQLLEAMDRNGVKKIVNTSTSWQHYDNEEYNPVNLYAATKEAFESLLTYYVNAKCFSAVSLSLFDTYGQNDKRGKLISLLWKAANSSEELEMSGGEQLIDLVHIDDVTDAYIESLRFMESKKLKKFAVSSMEPIKLIELVSIFERIVKKKLNIKWGVRPYRDREVFIPWTAFDPVPGWKPKRTLTANLNETAPDFVGNDLEEI